MHRRAAASVTCSLPNRSYSRRRLQICFFLVRGGRAGDGKSRDRDVPRLIARKVDVYVSWGRSGGRVQVAAGWKCGCQKCRFRKGFVGIVRTVRTKRWRCLLKWCVSRKELNRTDFYSCFDSFARCQRLNGDDKRHENYGRGWGLPVKVYSWKFV